MPDSPRQLELIAPSASPEEAAAVVAALERFIRATAPIGDAATAEADGWFRAAILEGLAPGEQGELRDPWINP